MTLFCDCDRITAISDIASRCPRHSATLPAVSLSRLSEAQEGGRAAGIKLEASDGAVGNMITGAYDRKMLTSTISRHV